MSLPTYPEYKDSGIAWIGGVPAHWCVRPLVHIATERSEPNLGMQENNLLSLSYGRIVQKDIEANDGLLPESFETYQIVRKGDIVLRLTDLQNDKRSLRSAQVGQRGIITSAYLALKPTGVDSNFLSYLLRAYDLTKVFYSMGGGLRQSMKFADLKRMPIVVPSEPEQSAIATFLDRETAKIDALIVEQEKLLALLAEKRQATISHAVTRGLDPNVPMKDSGIPWLGQVPANWKVTKCGRFTSILSGFAFPSSGFNHEGEGIRLLRGVNVGVSTLRWDDVVYWERRRGDGLDEYELKVGDLVIGMDRPLIAAGIRVAKVGEPDVPCLLLQRVALLRTSVALNSDLLMHFLSAPMFVAHFSPETTGVSVPHISPEQIASFVIAVPPIGEQERIVQFLAEELDRLSVLSTNVTKAIDLLKERRSALIAAAVTGQIDVRGAVEGMAA